MSNIDVTQANECLIQLLELQGNKLVSFIDSLNSESEHILSNGSRPSADSVNGASITTDHHCRMRNLTARVIAYCQDNKNNIDSTTVATNSTFLTPVRINLKRSFENYFDDHNNSLPFTGSISLSDIHVNSNSLRTQLRDACHEAGNTMINVFWKRLDFTRVSLNNALKQAINEKVSYRRHDFSIGCSDPCPNTGIYEHDLAAIMVYKVPDDNPVWNKAIMKIYLDGNKDKAFEYPNCSEKGRLLQDGLQICSYYHSVANDDKRADKLLFESKDFIKIESRADAPLCLCLELKDI